MLLPRSKVSFFFSINRIHYWPKSSLSSLLIHFSSMFHFYSQWKSFSDVCRGYSDGTLSQNGLILKNFPNFEIRRIRYPETMVGKYITVTIYCERKFKVKDMLWKLNSRTKAFRFWLPIMLFKQLFPKIQTVQFMPKSKTNAPRFLEIYSVHHVTFIPHPLNF